MKNVSQKGAIGVMLMAVVLAAVAQTAPASPEAAIADVIAKLLLIIGAGGLGYITLRLAHVGWVVGAKFISRLGGKA